MQPRDAGLGLLLAVILLCLSFSGRSATAQVARGGAGSESDYKRALMDFFDSVDRVDFRERVKLLREKQAEERQPDFRGMDDDIRGYVDGILDQTTDLQPSCRFTVGESILNSGFDLNADGSRLITLGDKIRIHDVSTGETTQEFEPVGNSQRVLFVGGTERFAEVTSNSLTIREIKDGKSVATWEAPEALLRVECSRDGTVLAAMTDGRRLLAFDGDLNQIAEYAGQKLAGTALSIEPKGKWIVANAVGAPVRWHFQFARLAPDEPTKQYEYLRVPDYNSATKQAVASSSNDRWYDSQRMDAFWGKDRVMASKHTGGHLTPKSLVWAKDCTTGSNSWMLCLFADLDDRNQPVFSICDVSLLDQTFSESVYLSERPNEISASADGRVIALGNREEVVVHRRRSWVDPAGYITQARVGYFLRAGRLEQLEFWLNAIRKKPVFKYGIIGEDHYSSLISVLGITWADIESQGSADELLSQLNEWAEKGSETAMSAKAQMHMVRAWRFYSNGLADSIEETDPVRFNEQLEKARELIEPLLEGESPPSIVFSLSITLDFLSRNYLGVTETLRRHAELYPLASAPHTKAMHYLSPQWGGGERELDDYAARYSELFAPEEQDMAYARCVVMGFMEFKTRLIHSQLNFQRFDRSIRKLLERNELTPDQLAKVTEVYKWLPTDAQRAEFFVSAYIRRFPHARPLLYFTEPILYHVVRLEAQRLSQVANSMSMAANVRFAWPPRRSESQVLADSTVEYIKGVDRGHLSGLVAKELEQAAVVSNPAIEGMDEDVRRAFKNVWITEPQRKLLFEIETDERTSNKGYSLSPDGQTLVTLGNEIRIWDANEGKAIRVLTNKKGFTHVECIDNGLAVFWGEKVVAKYDLSSGKGLGSWSGAIQSVAAAFNGELVGVITTDNHLVALDGGMNELAQAQEVAVSNGFLSVHPAGAWIIANTMDGPLRWSPSDGEWQVLRAQDYAPKLHQCASGSDFDYWFSGPYGLVYDGAVPVKPFEGTDYPAHMVNMWGLHAKCCEFGDDRWLLACCVLWDDRGDTSFNVCDLDFANSIYSGPTPLEFEPLGFSASRNAERIAVSSESKIQVIDRQTWTDPTGQKLIEFVGRLFNKGRFDQLDLLTRSVRALPYRKGRPSGEQLFGMMALRIGNMWESIDGQLEEPDANGASEQIDALADWRARGSELSVAASAAKFTARIDWIIEEIQKEAEQKGEKPPTPPVSREDLDFLRFKATVELDSLLAAKEPPAYAYEARLRIARDSKADIRRYEDLVERYLMQFPLESAAHGIVASWLFPAWSDTYALAGAYLREWSDRYPEEWRLKMYARGTIELYRYAGVSTTLARLSRDELSEASLLLHRDSDLTPEETLLLAAAIKALGKVEYHLLEHLYAISPLQPKRSYKVRLFTQMFHIRNRFSSGQVRQRFESQGP